MAQNNMAGLPFLPGNTFHNMTKTNFHQSQTLSYHNGYMFSERPEVRIIGGNLLKHDPLIEKDVENLANFEPSLTYGQTKPVASKPFVPARVTLDKKVLRFYCYFKETVHESPQEFYRVRSCQIFYYLEDDTIAVTEPKVENSGIPQGIFLRRHQIPKNEQGDKWHWTDLNNGVNVTFYGRTFHICDCDAFTREFLESEGIEVSPPYPADNDHPPCSNLPRHRPSLTN